MNTRKTIAKNIARYFEDGSFVNLGVGIPTLSANYVPEGVEFFLHAECGFAGSETTIPFPWDLTSSREQINKDYEAISDRTGANWKTGHKDLVDASNSLVILGPGASCFDSSISFAMARGGHLDMTVLGGLQVDEEANLANWMIPGKKVNGMGGAMDLVAGAKKVVVAMEHCSKDGAPKILKKCTFPLTAVNVVDVIVTELAIIEFIDGKLTVVAMAPGMTAEELQAKTEAKLYFADKIDVMDVVD